MSTWDGDVENVRMGESKMEHLWLEPAEECQAGGQQFMATLNSCNQPRRSPQVTPRAQERVRNAALLI